MKLESLKNKRILILGFGREGRDTFNFLRKMFPKKVLGIADVEKIKNQISKSKNIKKVKWYTGKNYLKSLRRYNVIVKSPGIPVHLPEVERAFKKGKITSQTEIFFENCPGKIVGITGTKGKSTTVSLICRILKEAGFKTYLVGNIGKPALKRLFKARPKNVYVYELSSHQLYTLKKSRGPQGGWREGRSPQVAVFLNIYPEHSDYYKNFKEYLFAKQNITRYQKREDYFVFNPKDINVRKTAKISKAKKVPINIKNIGKIVKSKDVPLKGEFNLLNVAAAVEVGKIFNVPEEKIAAAIKKFKPLTHRLEFVGTYKGIKFYNDSLSTIPETAISAIEALGNDVRTIFLGGFERNLDFTKLARKILKSRIKTVILFPSSGERIWKKITGLAKNKGSLPKHFFVDNMMDAVRLAYQNTEKRGICLLSCASPSFGIFRDYRERGNLFKKYVKLFGSRKKN